jgi:hypothetical protein
MLGCALRHSRPRAITALAAKSVKQDRVVYSKIRIDVPRGNTLKRLFLQEKATFEALIKGTFTLVLL